MIQKIFLGSFIVKFFHFFIKFSYRNIVNYAKKNAYIILYITLIKNPIKKSFYFSQIPLFRSTCLILFFIIFIFVLK